MLAILVGAVVVVGCAIFAVLALSEVVDRGKDLRPYESGPVYEVRVADSVTIYADAESKPDSDNVTGSVLVALATASLIALLMLRGSDGSRRLQLFYAISMAGFLVLAFDEFFAVHETTGHNLPFLADLPGIERPDDVIFALWLIPGFLYVTYFRDVLFSSTRLRRLFSLALVAAILTAVTDITGSLLDEPLEIVTAACIVAGFVSLLVDHLTAIVNRGRAASPTQA